MNKIYKLCDLCNPCYGWYNRMTDLEEKLLKRKLCIYCHQDKKEKKVQKEKLEELKKSEYCAGWVH